MTPERLEELRHNAIAYGLPRESMVELFAHIDALTAERDEWKKGAKIAEPTKPTGGRWP